MSFEQEDLERSDKASPTRSTLAEPGASSGGGPGILKLGVKSLQGMIIGPEEKLDKQIKKMGKQKSASSLNDVETESPETELKESLQNVRVTKGQQTTDEGKLRLISLDEIAWHDTPDDCWFAIYDYVYDCTSFIKDHPGGDDVLLEYAGRDATLAFIGAGHSKFAQKALESYLIGELPPNERIFRIDGGVKVYGL